jgi:hypothetical protein
MGRVLESVSAVILDNIEALVELTFEGDNQR